jgi:hypothetical protein
MVLVLATRIGGALTTGRLLGDGIVLRLTLGCFGLGCDLALMRPHSLQAGARHLSVTDAWCRAAVGDATGFYAMSLCVWSKQTTSKIEI